MGSYEVVPPPDRLARRVQIRTAFSTERGEVTRFVTQQVRTARGEGRLSRSDRDHLAYAVDNDWILFTFDNDFLRLVEGEGLEHAGIVYTDQAGMKVGDVVRAVDTFLEGVDPERRGYTTSSGERTREVTRSGVLPDWAPTTRRP